MHANINFDDLLILYFLKKKPQPNIPQFYITPQIVTTKYISVNKKKLFFIFLT